MKNAIERLFAAIFRPAQLTISPVATGFTGYILEANAESFYHSLKNGLPFILIHFACLFAGGIIWIAVSGPKIGIVSSLAVYLILSFLIFLVMRATNF